MTRQAGTQGHKTERLDSPGEVKICSHGKATLKHATYPAKYPASLAT